jgi:hypothetical protein
MQENIKSQQGTTLVNPTPPSVSILTVSHSFLEDSVGNVEKCYKYCQISDASHIYLPIIKQLMISMQIY